ncbi:MAG TPA: LutB/LldF family L-lactate oxidation iron-sulfur protein [Phycisphaerae bacterium]|nr:LutB/LldF family L-lactate oxidation iron-sulfur protein [Phycisphaerae bacterium]HOJ74364.1 LutB/LldF family L-lactate oxidation iron-sulfur protein [Phycisphaerae bacterium]HOM52988.1 LutB/LldF family L-lactate oxidation iron-sulfur protein [Phycisphaerae bacterium]HON68404.1 LutB/LldF family L-lactate oxidation iron-sulfur protein [Phycisphaerae bacterium]HOQ88014.1 LutB/LldF family L-lactate oxidation iron-sulfur protein [Phycisphaerae bacterium]
MSVSLPIAGQGASAGHAGAAVDFKHRAADAATNPRIAAIFDRSARMKDDARRLILPELPEPLATRELAATIKRHTLQNLDRYLDQFVTRVREHGGHVHFAADGAQANQIITEIAQAASARLIVKSKSMVSEEIELNHALEAAGFNVLETDLGEYILQLANEKPSHIVTPMAHKPKEEVGELFARKLGIEYSDDPTTLTKAARKVLRDRFFEADMGIIGANFAVADTGTVVIVTNEGNGRFCSSRPRRLVCLMGIEKLIPRMKYLPVFLKLLGKSATGQRITSYTSLISGPRRPGDFDGPEEFHLVLLDNGRTKVLASEYREALRCIRCGACLNACPIYRKIGGHAYDATYPGPIGSVISPLFTSLAQYADLPSACSLCGACLDACPVRIDLPTQLIHLRQDVIKAGHAPLSWKLGFKGWKLGMSSSFLYRMGARMGRVFMKLGARDGWKRKLPATGAIWTRYRDIPTMPKPFHSRWDELQKEIEQENAEG